MISYCDVDDSLCVCALSSTGTQSLQPLFILFFLFFLFFFYFFFQAEDGIRYLVRSRGLGDVYKRQEFDIGKQTVGFAKISQEI